MTEVWLRSNSRLVLAVALPLGAIGLVLLLLAAASTLIPAGLRVALGVLGLVALAGAVMGATLLGRARLARRGPHLLVRLRWGRPIALPLEVVEGFLLGTGDSLLPGGAASVPETRTVVIRLAERAEEWSHRPVEPLLGHWCDGYVQIRGTFAEPLNIDVVRKLNERLARAIQSTRTAESTR